jgi:hypothetical protein
VRFIAIASALLIAWRVCRISELRRYFASQLVAIMLIETALLRLSEHSLWYAAIYIAADLIVFSAMVPIVWRTLCFHPMRLIPILNGVAIGAAVWMITKTAGNMTIYQIINSAEGAFLAMCAVCAGLGAAYLSGTDRRIAFSVAGLWLAQAIYRFGFTLHIESSFWVRLNESIPTFLVGCGCLWLALFCKARTA